MRKVIELLKNLVNYHSGQFFGSLFGFFSNESLFFEKKDRMDKNKMLWEKREHFIRKV